MGKEARTNPIIEGTGSSPGLPHPLSGGRREDVLWRTLCHVLKLHLGACRFVAAKSSPMGKASPAPIRGRSEGYGVDSLGEAKKQVATGEGMNTRAIKR